MRNRAPRWGLAVLAVLIALGVVWLRNRGREGPERVQAISSEISGAPAPTAAPSALPAPGVAVPRAAAPMPRLSWERFKSLYGATLEGQFLDDGTLVSLRAIRGAGPGSARFDPRNPNQVLERARQILRDASTLLGISASAPLNEGQARGDAAGAQAFFRETLGGEELAPFGEVTVELGAGGELSALSSSYVQGPSAANSRNLSEDEARAVAQGGPDGRAVVWMPFGRGAGGVAGRRAWEFDSQGVQVVVDAENGQILSRHDRRRR